MTTRAIAPSSAGGMTVGNAVTGGGANRVLYEDASQNLAASASLLYSDTGSFGSGPQLQVGSGATTAAGWKFGTLSSAVPAMWPTNVTASGTNYVFAYTATAGGTVILNGAGAVSLSPNNVEKMSVAAVAGQGPLITAGTAGTDVAALSVTRTNNNAAVATGVKFAFTDTTSAAGFLPFQVLGGAAAATNLLSVSKAGLVDAPAYAAGGSAGVDFGPAAVASITVKKGIVIAIS